MARVKPNKKPELAFSGRTSYASMASTYEVIDNLKMRDILTLEETVRAFHTKETELTDLGAHQGGERTFCRPRGDSAGRGGRGGAGARTISRTADGGYAVQGYSSRPAINCFHCKKGGHGWRDCTIFRSLNFEKNFFVKLSCETVSSKVGMLFPCISNLTLLLIFLSTAITSSSSSYNIELHRRVITSWHFPQKPDGLNPRRDVDTDAFRMQKQRW